MAVSEAIQAAGIVAEYNPFHNGHLFHVQETRRRTGLPVIAVMSGSFMQRGEPACLSKWLRARLAVENGVDLVLELPAAFSLRSAQYFAAGAVQLLSATGCVSYLSCGVESPNLDFAALAHSMNRPEQQLLLRELLSQGMGYAAACARLLPLSGFDSPNDILALEYCRAMEGTALKPLCLPRLDGGYNSTEISGSMASATAIRRSLSEGSDSWQQAVPPSVRTALASAEPGWDEALLWQLISYRLRLLSPPQIAASCQCSEGLENLLKQAAGCASLTEALRHCTCKRYSSGRIRRLLLQLLLEQPRESWEQPQPAYLRILAFNDTGRRLLRSIKANCSLPLLTKLGKNPCRRQSSAFARQLALETAATDIWSLLQRQASLKRPGSDYLLSPVYIPGTASASEQLQAPVQTVQATAIS